MLEITNEIVAKGKVPMQPSVAQPYHTVIFGGMKEEQIDTKNGPLNVLNISFLSVDKEKEHKQTLFVPTIRAPYTDYDYSKAVREFQGYIKHVYSAFKTLLPTTTLGKAGYVAFTDEMSEEDKEQINSENFSKFFKAIINDFETGANGKPIYLDANGKPIVAWLKLVYDKDNNVTTPRSPISTNANFIERFVEGKTKPTTLVINPKYDKLVPSQKDSKPVAQTTAAHTAAADDVPDVPY
jgi:hypothetical protein